jgi:hypothetical protein
MHVDELLLAFNSYAEKDFDTTYKTLHEAYAHMFEVSKGLSGAIVDQFPEKFKTETPSEMPKTGMGGMSQDSNPWVWIATVLAVTSAMAAMVFSKKLVKE